jgi:hypothetical protein
MDKGSEMATTHSREDQHGVVRRLFLDHPRSLGMSWSEHGIGAIAIGATLVGAGVACLINEVERGEDYLKEKFETALDSGTLSGDCRAVVERCYQSVRAGHDQMSQLKHGMEEPSHS